MAYPLLFREMLLNNEQVRTAGAILEHSDAVTLEKVEKHDAFGRRQRLEKQEGLSTDGPDWL